MTPVHDIARIRLDNALLLFDEFVRQAARNPDAATLRGLEGRFAERLQIQPSYWSQIKSRSRQIGERLARQFEQRMHKPYGWMDQPHGAAEYAAAPATASDVAAPAAESGADAGIPRNDDERFIVGLVLTYYRRHPERARARLLDLLGEVLMSAPQPGEPGSGSAAEAAVRRSAVEKSADKDVELWRRSQQGVAPLRRKR
jgi:hypothetical protein